MGVLDEAIREHLELKRRRGADPGAVAREEGEALGSVGAGGSRAPGRRDEEHPAHPEDWGVPGAAHDSQPRRSERRQPGGVSDASQETAELDMCTVFDDADPATELARDARDPVEHDQLWLERDSSPSGLLA